MPLRLPAQFISNTRRTTRRGFTLVELLVVITIIGILTAVTVTTLDGVLQSSRVSGAARTIQAAMEGARDRASHGNAPRGLRLYFEELEGRKLVGSIAYLETAENETAGSIEVKRPDYYDNTSLPGGSPPYDYPVTLNPDGDADSDDAYILEGTNTNWASLYNRKLLLEGTQIKLGDWWYVIQPVTGADFSALVNSDPSILHLSRNYRDATGSATDIDATSSPISEYILNLAPVEMADEALISLPQGVYIDLSELDDHGKLPNSWDITATEGHVDIMFSPVGTLEGALSSHGLLHLPIVELEDVTLNVRFGDPNKEGNESLLTLFTQSGQVTKPPVDLNLANPFSFAERGVTE